MEVGGGGGVVKGQKWAYPINLKLAVVSHIPWA